MSTTYNIDFDVAALVLLIIEMVYLRLQYSHDKYSNRLFIMLLHSTTVFAVVDIASSLMLTTYAKTVPNWLLSLVMGLYFLTNSFLLFVFYRYIVEYLDDKKERTVVYYVKTYFPFVFSCECLIGNYFGNILFSIGRFGHFSYGSLISIIYVYPLYYYVLTLACLIRNRKRVNIRQSFSVVSFIFISVVTMVIQYFNSEIMTLSFGYAVALLILLFLLETPTYKSLLDRTKQLESVREQIESQDAFNRAFIRNVADDICKPIEKVLEKNALVMATSMDDTQKDVYQYVNSYGRLIRSTVNNVVEYSNTQDSNYANVSRSYSLKEIVNEVTAMMRPIAEDQSDSLVVEVSSNIPDLMMGFDLQIKQIMINMVNDAIKYTNNGTVTLAVNCRKIDNTHVNLLISVEDTGIGMKREMVKRLMRFNPAKAEWNKSVFLNANFNVCITKKLIEGMNGKLHIDSVPQKGATFSAVIPQEIP